MYPSIVFQGHLTYFKVTRRWKTDNLALIWVFPHGNWNSNSRMALKWHMASRGMEEVPYYFSTSKFKVSRTDKSTIWIWFGHDTGRSQLSNPSDLPCYFCHCLVCSRTDECISSGFFGFRLLVGLLVVDKAIYILVWKRLHWQKCLLKHSLYLML